MPNGTQLPFSAAILATGAIKRKRKVIVYARYSTDTQNDSSVEDQYAFCKQWIKGQGWDAQIVYECDRAISGEEKNRPGIDKVLEQIETGGIDALVVEDSSRLHRDHNHLVSLIRAALDAGTTVYGINDDLDSSTKDWELKAMFYGMHNACFNRDTSNRIKRASMGRWEAGYAMGPLRVGYKKVAVNPAPEGEPQKGPWRHVKDERWAPVIKEIFERIARGELPKKVAKFATQSGLPKRKNGNNSFDKWLDKNIRDMIRNPIYKGLERFGSLQSIKKLTTGKHIAVKADPEDIKYRDMPELAHVDADLWQRANDMLTGRQINPYMKPGRRNNVGKKRVMRDKFTCNICGNQMIKVDAGTHKAYRCTLGRHNECWNKPRGRLSISHKNILQAIKDRLKKQSGFLDLIVSEATRINRTGGDIGTQIERIRLELQDINKQLERLTTAIQKGGNLEPLMERMTQLSDDANRKKEKIKYLESQQELLGRPISREEILANIDAVVDDIADSEETWAIIRPLIDQVRAVPFTRVDGNRDVLRARVRLNLVSLLSQQWQALAETNGLADKIKALTAEFDVDLFEVFPREKNAMLAYRCCESGMKLREIQQKHGMDKSAYYSALKLGKLMAEAGVDDPFVELTHCPSQFKWADLPDNNRDMIAIDYKPDKSDDDSKPKSA